MAKAGFYGLDLYSLYRSIHEVISYLDRVDPAAAARARQHYACFDHFSEDDAQVYGFAAACRGRRPIASMKLVEQSLQIPRLHLQRRDEAGHEAQALTHPGQCSHQGRGAPPTVAGGRSGGRPYRPDAGGRGSGTSRSLRDPTFA